MALYLLDGKSMNVKARFEPRTMSLSLKLESLCTATVVVDGSAPDFAVNDWVKFKDPQGVDVVYYIKSMSTDYRTGLTTLNLEHGMGLLTQNVLYGEYTTQKLGGSSTSVDVVTAINTILSVQSVWALGDCSFPEVAEAWSMTNSTLYSALETITDSIENCKWTFDQTSLPWKLNLVDNDNVHIAEMRMARNITSLKVTLNTTDMATRVYPVGLKNLSISSANDGCAYLEKNVDKFGVIAKTVTDNSIKDAKLLKAYGQKMLNMYCQPVVSASISGYDLSVATGEALDKLVLGRKCRVPLPRYNTTVVERIEEIEYKDYLNNPAQVTINLATERKTVTHVVASKASGGGGGSKSNNQTQCEIDTQDGKITGILTSKLWYEKDTIGIIGGLFDASGDTIVLHEGAKMYVNRDGANVEVVDQGNVVSSINATKEAITINAAKINLNGYVTASQLEATTAKIDNLMTGTSTASFIRATSIAITDLNSRAVRWRTLTINGTSYTILTATTSD